MKKVFLTLLTVLCASLLARADKPSTHGMLIFGDKVTYASHLPMFHHPHDYQVIFKLTMQNIPRSMTLSFYENAKAAGETLFTIEPELMDLTQIIDGTKKDFSAKLYDGHFERDGKLLGWVKVVVEKIIYATKLNPNEPEATIDHLIFGESGEYFGAHIIKGKPSFDSIVQVNQPAYFGPCNLRACPRKPLKPILDQDLPIKVSQAVETAAGSAVAAGDTLGSEEVFSNFTKVIKVIYTEVDELSH